VLVNNTFIPVHFTSSDPVFSCSDSKGIHTPRLRKTETDFPCFPAAERSHCATVKTWSNHTNSQFVFISASATNQFCQPKHDPDFHDSRRHTSSLKQNCTLLRWLILIIVVFKKKWLWDLKHQFTSSSWALWGERTARLWCISVLKWLHCLPIAA